MAKNKGSSSSFDKFRGKHGTHLDQLPEGLEVIGQNPTPVNVPVDDDDKADPVEPTDTEPVNAPSDPNAKLAPGETRFLDESDPEVYKQTGQRQPTPFDKLPLSEARTAVEQEQIIARMHPKVTWEDPARYYNRSLARGVAVPEVRIKPDADDRIVKAFRNLERLVAGGLIVPNAYQARDEAIQAIIGLREIIEDKDPELTAEGSTSDAQSDSGSAHREEALVG